MRIALIGYGKMGREIERAAIEQGETIAKTFDIGNPVDAASLSDVDMCIEFSTPQTVLQNIRAATEARKDIVVGTTGWYDDFQFNSYGEPFADLYGEVGDLCKDQVIYLNGYAVQRIVDRHQRFAPSQGFVVNVMRLVVEHYQIFERLDPLHH